MVNEKVEKDSTKANHLTGYEKFKQNNPDINASFYEA